MKNVNYGKQPDGSGGAGQTGVAVGDSEKRNEFNDAWQEYYFGWVNENSQWRPAEDL